MKKPVVALVGRPNVGKSTLFNRLVGERMAIVDDVPGTTRDRLMAEAEWIGRRFDVVDTGGIDPAGGSGKPLSIGSADFISQIRTQALSAIQEADVVLFLVDADAGVTPADTEVAEILRKNQTIGEDGKPYPPVFLVVNKTDNARLRQMIPQFYEMGLGEPYPISALHGTETGDLLDDLVAVFPDLEEEEDDSVKIAIVGKPNVGKSSLLNRILGEERSIVSPIAGTTRDAVDTKLVIQDIPVTLIDTAGIRRRGKIEQGVEKFSVIRAMQAIERCDVALLVIDAESGISAQDTHIAGYILQEWKSAVVMVNKWDLPEKDNHTMNRYIEMVRRELNFMDYVPILFISAKTGQRVDQVMPMALRVQEERIARITTGQLNRILQNAQDRHAAPTRSGQAFKIYYANQVRSNPPTFLIHVNDPKLAHFTYVRYLENCIRKEYEFLGTPIRLVLKARR